MRGESKVDTNVTPYKWLSYPTYVNNIFFAYLNPNSNSQKDDVSRRKNWGYPGENTMTVLITYQVIW